MNEELHLLLGMMNEEGEETLAEGGNQPLTGSEMAGNRSITTPPQEEVEITDEMRNQFPVVNNARRGGNRIQGVTNFLANPEVQNALIQFGQAFSNAGNFTGQPNPVDQIGDAGQNLIRSQANQRALQAFEEGRPIAETAGRFADSELVAGLQERRQQEEQFEERMEVQAEGLDIRRSQLENDALFQRARLNLDEEAATQRAQEFAQQQELDEQIGEARVDYYQAQAEALRRGAEGEGDQESLALRSNEFLQLLDQREQVLQSEVQNLEDVVEEARSEGGLSTMDVLRAEFESAFDPLTTQELQQRQEEAVESNPIVQQAENQLEQARNRLESLRAERQAVQQAQSARLGGTPSADQTESDGDTETTDATAEGTWEAPVSVSSQQDLERKPDGSIVQFGGQVYMWRNGRLFPREDVEGGE